MVEELILRPFQVPVVDEVREARRTHQNVLLQAPTGFGKTACFTYMVARSYLRGDTVHVHVHLIELLEQIAKRFDRYGIPYDYIASGSGYPGGDERVKLVMTSSLVRRLDQYDPPDWAIEDECHHVESNTRQKIREWAPNTRFLGCTATAVRLDNKPLNRSYSHMVCGPQRKELQAVGQLVPCVLYYPPNDIDFSKCRKDRNGEPILEDQATALDEADIMGDVIEHYKRICYGVQFIVFAPTLDYSDIVAEQFNAAGIPTAVISSELNKHERKAIFTGYESGSIWGLVNVNLMTEGVDVAGCGCIIWLRRTESETIYDQGNGRAMRADEENDKVCCWIIDHVGNSFKHGAPDCDRFYSLDAEIKIKKKKGDSVIAMKRCEVCFCCWDTPGNECPQCGTVLKVKEREIITVDGQLVMLADEAIMQKLMLREQRKKKLNIGLARCKRLSDFEALGIEMGYDDPKGWAWSQWMRRRKKAKEVDCG